MSTTTRKVLAFLLIPALTLGITYPVSAASGDLDATFGTGGKVITNFGANNDQIYSSALQSDGKIVVAGSSNNNFAIARYTTSGDLDTSFDTDGLDPVDFGSTDAAYAVAVQGDGKIVVAGKSNDNFALVRLNSNGLTDSTFDTDGKVTTDLLSTDAAQAIAIQNDGKIVVAGKSNDNFAVARYNSDGSLDTSFNALGAIPGTLITDFGATDQINSMALQSDGKIVVAGTSGNDVAIARYLTDGSLDTSFSGDGKQTGDFSGGTDKGNSVAIQSDGKIVIGCYATPLGGGVDFGVLRYTSSGNLDTTFDSDGKVTTPIGTSAEYIQSILIMSDGKILAVGQSNNGTNYDVALVRYNADGSLDTSFSDDGKVTTSMGSGNSYGNTALLQSDGKIVVAGYTNIASDFYVARYTDSSVPNAPTLNTVTGGDRRIIITFTAGSDNGASITDYEYSLNSGSFVSAGTTASPITVTGLNGRISYSVSIRARNSIGVSAASSALSATTSDDAADGAAARERQEILDLLSLIPPIASMSTLFGTMAVAASKQKCVKGKEIRLVTKGKKCPAGYKKK